MNSQGSSSTRISNASLLHCQHRSATGRHCRMAISGSNSTFCLRHGVAHQTDRNLVNLSTTLTTGLPEFKSAVPINDFLSRLLKLQAEDLISPRRAAVMAYTANLLLRTLPAIEKELHPTDHEPPRLDFTDWPHPDRSGQPANS